MKVVGIIAEYNPFHNGHLYHLTEAKKRSSADACICIISGNFTQRGEAAILDKWQRARLAANCGADLVLELPFVFSVRSAEAFALGGVSILSKIPEVKTLAFGSECTQLGLLQQAAQAFSQEDFRSQLQQRLKMGQSYAAAVSASFACLTGAPEQIFKEPNTILSIEYLKAIQKNGSRLQPLPIERNTAQHRDAAIHSPIASANAVRQELFSKKRSEQRLQQALPEAVYTLLCEAYPDPDTLPTVDCLFSALRLQLLHLSRKELYGIAGISEGLENKLLQAARTAKDMTEFLQQIKSRRYPQSRLQRLLLAVLLHFTQEDAIFFDTCGPLYARVLAANKMGCQLLKNMKKTTDFPVITKTTHYINSDLMEQKRFTPLQKMLAYDILSADLYSLCFQKIRPGGQDFSTSPYIFS